MVKFRGTDEHTERADGQANIGVNVDRPNATKGDQAREGFQGETKDEGRKVDKAQGVDRIERVFAVSGEPVEMLGTVVDCMKPPQKADAVLEAMAPVNEEIAEENNQEGLEPPGLRSDAVAEILRNNVVEPVAEVRKRPQDKAVPEEILAEEKAEVRKPGRTKEALPTLGRKDGLERLENQDKKQETEADRENERVKAHGSGPISRVIGSVWTVEKWRDA